MSDEIIDLDLAKADLVVELIDIAVKLANSVKADVEENPDAASNETCIIVNEFYKKLDELKDDTPYSKMGLQ